jgi:hypothetical protein
VPGRVGAAVVAEQRRGIAPTLTDTASVRENLSRSRGGGIYNYYADTFLRRSGSVAGNYAEQGGGIFNEGRFADHGVHMFDRGSVAGNRASDRAGGIWNEAAVDMHDTSSITMNSADGTGGIYDKGYSRRRAAPR